MRFRTFQTENGQVPAAARGHEWVHLTAARPVLPHTLKEILAEWPGNRRLVEEAIQHGPAIDPQTARILAPIPDPQKVICIGLNYADHARETGKEPPSEPVVFNKLLTAVRAHGDDIVLPKVSDQVDYEAELVVVIGKRGKDISVESALDHVAGYCCGNDVSARDWQAQKPGKQWLLGKSFDSFGPFGPDLVTADEVGDHGNLAIGLRINGEVMQNSRTSQLIFSVPKLIAYISQVCTLMPGDVLFTGTPPGVGMARTPPRFLKAGDVVEVEIEKLGILRNPVVAG